MQRGLSAAYTKATGNQPPRASDPDASLRRIVVWAATTAVAVAVVNVVIDRQAGIQLKTDPLAQMILFDDLATNLKTQHNFAG